ncbi:RepB family DNA primase [Paludibaculum fermentans]|uniref:RepB family DNA primase n=1 Tax=Paludibaculum fermentans TaxID=1473598 RepID=UPI003EBADE54
MDRTSQAVQRQIAAMGAQVFEVGLFKPSAQEEGQAVMIPRTWDRDTLLRSIPWLRLQNADGRNIYVRPKGEHDLSLVDDLTAESLKRMKLTGFSPAVVVETSPGNFQAWLKHPRPLPREVSTLVARRLAEEFGGDRGAADWRHFGRLAGLTNRKPKYLNEAGLFPYVQLVEASGGPYPQGSRFLEAIYVQHEIDLRSREREHERAAMAPKEIQRQIKSIEDFRSNPRYGGDATREDLAFAIYALAHGLDTGRITSTLRSRDLSHKGDDKRQTQYVERTLAKALRVMDGRTL